MTNLEFYKEEIEKRYHYINTQSNEIFTENLMMAINDVYQKFGLSSIDILDWLCDEHQILDKEEKEYLSAVIRPFRNKVKHIVKWQHYDSASTDETFIGILLNKETISLPYFESNTMYKGMEINKKYTLEELGL